MREVVDLGTKKAGAIDEFRKAGSMYFGDRVKSIQPKDCIGIDRKNDEASTVFQKGYVFCLGDVLDILETLPPANYYLAWDFLEHLPNKEASTRVLKRACDVAQLGVWLRMPSFEQDGPTSESTLRAMGLRFAWSHWKGHKSHYLVEDAINAIFGHPRVARYEVRPGKKILSSTHADIVPIDAPIDTIHYDVELGPKEKRKFDPPLVGQWEVLIYIKS